MLITYTHFVVGGMVQDSNVEWVLSHPNLCNSKIPPGVSNGFAGLAALLLAMGFVKDGKEMLQFAIEHPLLINDRLSSSFCSGLTGIGLVCMYFSRLTGSGSFLKKAKEIGDSLIKRLDESDFKTSAEMCLFFNGLDGKYRHISEEWIQNALNADLHNNLQLSEKLNLLRLICHLENRENYQHICEALIEPAMDLRGINNVRKLCAYGDAVLDCRCYLPEREQYHAIAMDVADILHDFLVEAPKDKSAGAFLPGDDFSSIRISPTNTAMVLLFLNRVLQEDMTTSIRSSPYFFLSLI